MSAHKKIFLALDTSSEIGMLLLFDPDEIYYAQSLEEKYAHGQLLFNALDQALDLIKTNNMSLEAVFVGLGPGSFVGLRIALAAALGFCFGRSLPLMGFSSHRAFAHTHELSNISISTKASGDLCYLTSFVSNTEISYVVPKSDIINSLKNSQILITNLDFDSISSIRIIKSYGPEAKGIQKACLQRLAELGQIVDEIAYIKPNYVKAPSVSVPKIFSAPRVS